MFCQKRIEYLYHNDYEFEYRYDQFYAPSFDLFLFE